MSALTQDRFDRAVAAIEENKGVTLTPAQKAAGWNLCQNLSAEEFDRMVSRLIDGPTNQALSAEATIRNALGMPPP